MPKIEQRYMPSSAEILTREEGEGKERYAEGMGVVYNRETKIFDWLREIIRPGAFDEFLRENPEVKSFFNHSPNQVLSTTQSNPALEISDTDEGLRYRSPIPPTTYGNDLAVNLERGNVRGSSFAFRVVEDVITENREDDTILREITKAEIYEVGPVTNPAYVDTTADVRSSEDVYEELSKRFVNKNSGMGLESCKRKLLLTERGQYA